MPKKYGKNEKPNIRKGGKKRESLRKRI